MSPGVTEKGRWRYWDTSAMSIQPLSRAGLPNTIVPALPTGLPMPSTSLRPEGWKAVASLVSKGKFVKTTRKSYSSACAS
jgi:hypothetical protein